MSKIKKYSGENFQELVAEGITLVDFYATWCGPCQMLSSVLEKMSETVEYNIIKVDTDEYSDLPTEFKVRSLPTMLVFKNGVHVETMIGFLTEDEINKKMKKIKK